MKRGMLMLLAAVMGLCLAACGGGEKAAELDVHAAMETLLAEAPIQEAMELTEADMLSFYGIEADQMADFAAVTCAMGIAADEIVIVKAADEDSAQAVEELLLQRLENRKSEFQNYLPDQYEVLTRGTVERDGVYVRLIVSPQSEALAERYSALLKGEE